jgi:threonine dehydrogenase-like Zn-dependent dehydrogenase
MLGRGNTGGVLAEFARIPFADNTLRKIPEGINEEAGLLISNILSVANTGLIMSRVGIGDTVAIFGAGAVGLAAAMCTPLFGSSQVMVIDTVDYRLDLARKLGAIPVNASSVDTVAAIKGLTYGRGVDVGIEAAGNADMFKQCVAATREGGRISILGSFHEPVYFDIAGDSREISSLAGGESQVETLINMVRNDKIKPKSLISHRLPFSEIRHGYEIFENKLDNCIKIVFKF